MKQWWQNHRWAVVGLVIFYLTTTIPFLSRTPFNWDAAQFTLGVEHFSLHMHQPHPPGYPLFILVGKLFHLVLSAHASLVLESVLFGLVAVVMLYVLAVELWPERRMLAWIVALTWTVNPLFWLYRETALTYTVDAAAVITVAWLVWRTIQYRKHAYLVASVCVVAISGGFRPSLLALLLPLVLYQAWYHKRNWRFLLKTTALGLVLWLAWFIPLVALGGGWQAYRIDSQKLFTTVSEETSVFAGASAVTIIDQLRFIVVTVSEAWNVVLLGLVILLVAAIVTVRRDGIRRYTVIIQHYGIWVMLWLLPALFIYGFVHLGQLGYLILLLPLGYIALGAAYLWLQQWLPTWPLAVVVFGLHALVFMWLRPDYAHPDFLPRNDSERMRQEFARAMPNLFKMNRYLIADQDAKHEAYLEILQQYDPAQTLIITGRGITYNSLLNGLSIRNDELFRELSAIAPQYHIIELGPERDYYLSADQNTMTTTYAETLSVPPTIRYVIFALDMIPSGLQPEGLLLERRRLPGSDQSYYLGIMDKPWHWLSYTIEPALSL